MNNFGNLNFDLNSQFLPNNWKRQEFIGKPGLSDGKIKVRYYDDTGKCFKNKAELQRHFGSRLDLSILDFKTGKLNEHLIKRSIKKNETKLRQQLKAPFRQTNNLNPMLTKIKMNVLKTQPSSKVNHDLKPMTDKPNQVFWEKRLSNLRAICNNRVLSSDDVLPSKFKTFGPEVDKQTAALSISSSLHLRNQQGVFGQESDSKILEKNPSVFINSDQPLVQALIITDDDIRKQEERVLNARKKIEATLKANSFT